VKLFDHLVGDWRLARCLDRISILEFKLDHATWDERRRELNIGCEANYRAASLSLS
jgi:hypothetical protein